MKFIINGKCAKLSTALGLLGLNLVIENVYFIYIFGCLDVIFILQQHVLNIIQ